VKYKIRKELMEKWDQFIFQESSIILKHNF